MRVLCGRKKYIFHLEKKTKAKLLVAKLMKKMTHYQADFQENLFWCCLIVGPILTKVSESFNFHVVDKQKERKSYRLVTTTLDDWMIETLIIVIVFEKSPDDGKSKLKPFLL